MEVNRASLAALALLAGCQADPDPPLFACAASWHHPADAQCESRCVDYPIEDMTIQCNATGFRGAAISCTATFRSNGTLGCCYDASASFNIEERFAVCK